MRILIVQTAFLGDVVLTLSLVQSVQQYFPDAQVEMLTVPDHASVVRGQPGLAAVITYDKRGNQRGLRGFVNIVRTLRDRGYDLALSPHRSLRSALLLACSGIPRRIGFAQWLTGWAYTDTVTRPATGHEVKKSLKLLTPLAPFSTPQPGRLVIQVSPESRQKAQVTLFRHGVGPEQTLIGMIPGSQWGTKRWPADRFAALISYLTQRSQIRVVLFGGSQDRCIAEAIIAGCQTPVIDLIGQTPLPDLAAYLDCCRVVVSNDTGPMHIAAALGKPIVVLYGPTTPELGFYPYGVPWEAASVSLPCRPCHAHGPQRCPVSHWRCMLDLSVERVAEGVHRLLERTLVPREEQI